jgi:hypothetical protein
LQEPGRGHQARYGYGTKARLSPWVVGSHKIYVPIDFASKTITGDMVRNYDVGKGIDAFAPSDGLNLSDGAIITAVLTNADGEVMARQSATVEAHPFLCGLFS